MMIWQIVLLSLYGLVLLGAFSRHPVCSHAIRHIPIWTPKSPRWAGPDFPLVSIMVPAKDESGAIEGCLRSLLAQDYPNFEILVVDDRSVDDTADIVRRIAEEDDRLRLIQIKHLPPGWTGKTHALDVCRQHAKGEWFLFVDADTRHHPSCVSVTLRDCVDHGAQMGSLLPALESNSFWENVVQPFAGTCLVILFPITKANDPRCKNNGFANGQFILVHRDAYEEIGGHFAVRDKFVEDIHLGRNIRKQGLNLRVGIGSAISSVRMYSSFSAIVRGWSRIFYSGVDFKPAKLIAMMAFIVIFSVLPYAVIAGNGLALALGYDSLFVKLGLAMGVVHELSQIALYARTYAVSKSKQRYLAFRWLAVFAMLYILARTIRMCKTHEVIWRGTAYNVGLQTAAATRPGAEIAA